MRQRLILVDESNRPRHRGKTVVHRAGLLHRAFSIFIVDDQGAILLQRRSAEKYHSGGLWANSCCGHPRPGETTLAAARRRLHEELGVDGPLSFGFFTRYRAELDGGMQENEFVYVYFGPLTAQPDPDPAEVSEVEFASPDEICEPHCAPCRTASVYWLRHYFENHGPQIARLAKRAVARRGTDFFAAARSRKREPAIARR